MEGMSAAPTPSPFNSWETVRCELLHTRVCDLGLKIEGSPIGAVHRAAAPRVRREGTGVSPFVLPDRLLGMPRPRAGHRHPLLPGRQAARPDRGGADRRDRRRPDDDDAGASRGGPYGQLRLPAVEGPGLGRGLRPVLEALPREVPPAALEPRVRPPRPRQPVRPDLRPKASRRGFRRDVRRLAHAAVGVAEAVSLLARPEETRVRRYADAADRQEAAAAHQPANCSIRSKR